MNELEHWFRYDFLPRQRDGAAWRDKPVQEAALHFLKEQEEEIDGLREISNDLDY